MKNKIITDLRNTKFRLKNLNLAQVKCAVTVLGFDIKHTNNVNTGVAFHPTDRDTYQQLGATAFDNHEATEIFFINGQFVSKKPKHPWSTDDLNHKDLVWCWEDSSTHQKVLRFWNKQLKRTFAHDGDRIGYTYDNYAPYKGKIEKWMKKAHKTLAD